MTVSAVCVLGLVTQACPTPCDPVDLSMGIVQVRILEWVAMSSSRGSSQPRDRTQVSSTAGGFFTVWATGEVPIQCPLRFQAQGDLCLRAHALVPMTETGTPE